MPKFCQQCGSLVEDSASFCGSCGAKMTADYPEEPAAVTTQSDPYHNEPAQPSYPQQPAYQQPTYQQPTYQQPAYQQPAYQQPSYPQPAYQQQYSPAPAPKKKGKKVAVIIIVAVLVLALLAATVLIVVLPLVANIDVFGLHLFGAKASTPQECVDTFIESLADNNTDTMLDCIFETKYSEMMRSVMKAQLTSDSGMSGNLAEIRSMGKDKVKKIISITVTDEKPMSDSDAETLKQTLAAAMVPVEKIEKIEKANVHMENKEKNTTQDTEFTFAFAEGKWYILASAMSGSF